MPPSTRSAPEGASFDHDLARVRALLNGGHAATAAREIEALLVKYPGAAELWTLSGEIAVTFGQLDEATRRLKRATEIAPNASNGWLALARCQIARRDTDGAIAAFDRVLVLDPQSLEALVELSRLLAGRRLWPAAIALSQRALIASRGHRNAYLEFAKILLDAGQPADALKVLDDRLRQAPDDVEVLAASGQVMIRLKRHDAAMARYRAALARDPACRLAADGLTASLIRTGQIDEARRVVAAKVARWPDDAAIRSQSLFLLNYAVDVSAQQVTAAHREWGAWITGRTPTKQAPRIDTRSGRRLRIAYLSADLCRHSVAHFLVPVLEHHDRGDFEVFCYSVTPFKDDFTERIAGLVAHWREVTHLDDNALTDLIRADGIDLLIDLGGHTADHRLGVFARRAAPVQATWLGYPNTTGLPAMDFRISDAVADPVATADPLNSEILVRLTDGFLCYRAPVSEAVAKIPSAPGRPFTFGSFNHIAKINDGVLASWAAILRESPHSRLFLKAAGLDSAATQSRLRDFFHRAGVADGRVLLQGNTAGEVAHFSAYADIDLALDPFPYNGTTTTCDALWMGVPVLTVRGDRHAARVGASLLLTIGRSDLVAESPDEYVAKAIAMASHPESVRGWRPTIAQALRHSPLMDEVAFTRKLEAAYRRMVGQVAAN